VLVVEGVPELEVETIAASAMTAAVIMVTPVLAAPKEEVAMT